jgi:hypothetical protein
MMSRLLLDALHRIEAKHQASKLETYRIDSIPKELDRRSTKLSNVLS